MFESHTLITLKDGRDGIVKNKRKVSGSNPIAWQYQIEFNDGSREWVVKYDVRLRSAQDRLVEEAARFRTTALAAQFHWKEHSEFDVNVLLPLWGSRAKLRVWWEAEQVRRNDAALMDWVRGGGPLKAGNPIYVALNADGEMPSLWDGWHRVAAALLSNTDFLFAVVGTRIDHR